MKKLQCVCVLLCLSVCLCAAASFKVGEQVEQLAAMHDYKGGAYVLYVQNGQLKILYEDANSNIEVYSVFEDTSGAVDEIVSLQSLSNGYFNAILAVCKKNSKTIIKLYYVYTSRKNMAVAEITLENEVYDLQPVLQSGRQITIYGHTENRLLALTFTINSGIPEWHTEYVFNTEGAVTELQTYQYGIRNSSYGYYAADRKNGKDIYFFEHNMENGLSAVYHAGIYAKDATITLYGSQNDTAVYILENKSEKTIYEGTSFSFIKKGEYGADLIKQFVWFGTQSSLLFDITQTELERFCNDTVQDPDTLYVLPVNESGFAVVFQGLSKVQSVYLYTFGAQIAVNSLSDLHENSILIDIQYADKKSELITYDEYKQLLTKWQLKDGSWVEIENNRIPDNSFIIEKLSEKNTVVSKIQEITLFEKAGGILLLDYETMSNPVWIECELAAYTTMLNDKKIAVFYDGMYINSKLFGGKK